MIDEFLVYLFQRQRPASCANNLFNDYRVIFPGIRFKYNLAKVHLNREMQEKEGPAGGLNGWSFFFAVLCFEMTVNETLKVDLLFIDAFFRQTGFDIFKEGVEIHILTKICRDQAKEVILLVVASDGLYDITQKRYFFESGG